MVHTAVVPQGLERAHVATRAEAAEMLRELLSLAEFHPEFAPSDRIGIFGVSRNDAIHMPATEDTAAREIIEQYLAAASLAADADCTIDQQKSRGASTSDKPPALGGVETLRLDDNADAPPSAAAGRPWYWWTALDVFVIIVICVLLKLPQRTV